MEYVPTWCLVDVFDFLDEWSRVGVSLWDWFGVFIWVSEWWFRQLEEADWAAFRLFLCWEFLDLHLILVQAWDAFARNEEPWSQFALQPTYDQLVVKLMPDFDLDLRRRPRQMVRCSVWSGLELAGGSRRCQVLWGRSEKLLVVATN